MTGVEAINTFRGEIGRLEGEAFEADAESFGVLQAQNRWQGHDNGIVWAAWDEAVRELEEYGEAAALHLQPEDGWEERYASAGDWLLGQCAERLGKGQPVAAVGDANGGVYTAVCDDATEDEVRVLAADHLPEEAAE